MSNDLSWNKHIDGIITKASKRLYVLYQLKRAGVSQKDLLRVYLSVIRPVVEYACPVWHTNLRTVSKWSKRGPLGQYTPECRILRPLRIPACKLYSTEGKNYVKSILPVSNVRTTSCITYSLHHVMCHIHLGKLPLLYSPRLNLSGILIR